MLLRLVDRTDPHGGEDLCSRVARMSHQRHILETKERPHVRVTLRMDEWHQLCELGEDGWLSPYEVEAGLQRRAASSRAGASAASQPGSRPPTDRQHGGSRQLRATWTRCGPQMVRRVLNEADPLEEGRLVLLRRGVSRLSGRGQWRRQLVGVSSRTSCGRPPRRTAHAALCRAQEAPRATSHPWLGDRS